MHTYRWLLRGLGGLISDCGRAQDTIPNTFAPEQGETSSHRNLVVPIAANVPASLQMLHRGTLLHWGWADAMLRKIHTQIEVEYRTPSLVGPALKRGLMSSDRNSILPALLQCWPLGYFVAGLR